MNEEKQPFEKAMHLFILIQQNVQLVAEEVVSKYPKDQQSIDSAKVGCYECWVNRLTGMLRDSDRDYLLQLMQQHVDKPSSRD